MPLRVSPEPHYPYLDTGRDHRVSHLVSMTIETTPDSIPRGMVGFCVLAPQLSFDCVGELPQRGDCLRQIGKLSVESAGCSHRCNGQHHTELLERLFHGCSFDKIPFVTVPATEGSIACCCVPYSCVG
jgi:hypothetical protein